MFGIGSVVSALPVMCFPRKFREKPKLQSSSLKNERPVKVMGGNRIVDYNLLDNHMFIYKSSRHSVFFYFSSLNITYHRKGNETSDFTPVCISCGSNLNVLC
jgi:hypothetical protein